MALSFSRPDPSSPNAVASATFSTARRGFDQTEVRDLLRMVAAELGRLQERERFLDRELRAAQHSTTSATVALDDEVVTRMLGEEAARILHTARDGAAQIKARSEEGAARLLREASEEAQRLRQEAEVESARRRADATADAESELEMARQQGREMVNEARAYRERVLGELSRRREMARQQIEQLVHGRDRLLQAFERARLAAVDVMADLTPIGAPAEFVNLSPTTGPVPVMVPAGHLAQAPPAAQTVDEMLADLDEMVPAPVVDDAADQPADADAEPAAADMAEAVDAAEAAEEAAAGHDGDDHGDDDTVVQMPEAPAVSEHHDDRDPAPVVALFAGELDQFDRPPAAGDASSDAPRSADDLFARLRAARLDEVAERAARPAAEQPTTPTEADAAQDRADPTSADPTSAEPAGVEPVDATVALSRPDGDAVPKVFEPSAEAPPAEATFEDTPFGRRDAELTPIILSVARKVKRVLADEQNEVLSTLRRAKGVSELSDVLPGEAEHLARYGAAMTADLEKAAVAGAVSVDPDATLKAHKAAVKGAKVLTPALDWFDQWLVAPLRERMERAVVAAEGDNEELATLVRSIYREWKTQRIDEYLDDVARMAYGRGQLAALAPGTPVCWAVDPNGPDCPDAEDNSLAGTVPAGEAFPTSHLCAPAHEGCRCLLIPAPR